MLWISFVGKGEGGLKEFSNLFLQITSDFNLIQNLKLFQLKYVAFRRLTEQTEDTYLYHGRLGTKSSAAEGDGYQQANLQNSIFIIVSKTTLSLLMLHSIYI